MNFLNDTIVAISTPLSPAALGIIRISGPQSLTLTRQLTQKQQYDPHRATLTWINLSPELKDQAIVTFYPAPRSYTGEDLVEISVHGNPLLMKLVIRELVNRNARMADRGEFTKRAFLNGKIDLSQADAVLAMINAKSLNGLTHAANSLEGRISSTVSKGLDYIEQTAAELEVCISISGEILYRESTFILRGRMHFKRISPILLSLVLSGYLVPVSKVDKCKIIR